jgi:hypothetical protein
MNEIVRFARSSSHPVSSEALPSQLEIEQSPRRFLSQLRNGQIGRHRFLRI